MCDVDSNVGDKGASWKAEERCRFRSGSEKGRRDHTGEATLQTREQRTSGEKAQTNASQELPEPQSAHPRGHGQSRWGGVFLKAQLGWGGAAGGNHLQERPGESGREGPHRPRWGGQVHRSGPQPSSTRATCSQAWALQRLQPGVKAGSRALWSSSLAWRPHMPVPTAPASGDSRCGWWRARGMAQGLSGHRHSPPPQDSTDQPPCPLQGPGHLPGPPAGALAGSLRPG